MDASRKATLADLLAILLWSSLALLTVATEGLPPFQVLAIAFAVAGLAGLARAGLRGGAGWAELRQPGSALALSSSG